MQKVERVLISRTDNLGDVILTLPLAGYIKSKWPSAEVFFLGKAYTKPLIDACIHVDRFLDWDALASLPENEAISTLTQLNISTVVHVFPNKVFARLCKRANIPMRIGTTNRIFHWTTCNKLVKLSRKNSPFHESELNFVLLKPIFPNTTFPSKEEIASLYGFSRVELLEERFASMLNNHKVNVILHPKSKGSAREWGVDNYQRLIYLLGSEKYNVFVTGTEAEGVLLRDRLIKPNPTVVDLTGKMSLSQLVSFIASADALVACSTGPLHIASALGKLAIGIFPPIRPMHPGRWAPIGAQAKVLVKGGECSDCRKTAQCQCITDIQPEEVAAHIQGLLY